MSNTSVNTETVPMLSAEEEAQAIAHLRALQAIVKNRGQSTTSAVLGALPDASSSPEWADLASHIAKRTILQVQRCAAKREADAVSAYKSKIAALLAPHVVELGKAKAEYDKLSPVMRAMVNGGKGFPASLPLPITAVASAFPANTPPEAMGKVCKSLGYTLSRQAKETYIVISLPTPAPEPAGERRAMNAQPEVKAAQ